MKTFKLTEDHIKLVNHFYIGWLDCEYGAPEVNPKRPYGNSDVEYDIHELLTGECADKLSDEQKESYYKLHRETEKALQIILATKSFEPGTYVRDEYDSRAWTQSDKSNLLDGVTFIPGLPKMPV